MTYAAERRWLQTAIAGAGTVPVAIGFQGIIAGLRLAGSVYDSHYRFLSGVLLGLGAAIWSTIPDIERRGELVRLLTLIIVVGGLAQLGAYIAVGGPGVIRYGLALALVLAPLLCWWRERIERLSIRPGPWSGG